MKGKWLVGQGAAAVDTLLYCKTQLNVGSFTASCGEQITSGGSCANLLVAAAQLGMPAALLAKIGDDDFGLRFRRELVEDGVDDRYLQICPGGTTLHTYIAVTPDGERSIIVEHGDCFHNLCLEQISEDILEDAAVYYTDGANKPVTWALTARAAEKGVPVFYQRECQEWLSDEALLKLDRQMMDTADLISGGPEIYRELVGDDRPESAMRCLYERHHPASGVVMTAGRMGAWWYDGRELLHQDVFPVKALDSTGAGDTFCGGLIYAYYYRGMNKRESLRFAAACGAMKCTVAGPRLRASEEAVREFMHRCEKENI